MDKFIASLEILVREKSPELLPLFTSIAAEAQFGYAVLRDDFSRLPAGAALLEVGGGTMLLSCHLAAEGFAVTAVEPTGEGFGEFEKLRAFILAHAPAQPRIAACGIEDFVSDERFDFAFSINVMEHVGDWRLAITKVAAVLKVGAAYRFICPNYVFPYEPHFNIPIIYSKALTAKLFAKKIQSSTMDDAAGVWQSLNWICVPTLQHAVAKEPSLTLRFKRDTLVWMLERAVRDAAFAARRSRWMIALIRGLVASRLHTLAAVIPASLQPLMDVTLVKKV